MSSLSLPSCPRCATADISSWETMIMMKICQSRASRNEACCGWWGDIIFCMGLGRQLFQREMREMSEIHLHCEYDENKEEIWNFWMVKMLRSLWRFANWLLAWSFILSRVIGFCDFSQQSCCQLSSKLHIAWIRWCFCWLNEIEKKARKSKVWKTWWKMENFLAAVRDVSPFFLAKITHIPQNSLNSTQPAP